MKQFFLFSCLIAVFAISHAQDNLSTPSEILEAVEKRKALAKESILKEYPLRNIGPVVQGARISDLAVHSEDYNVYYVAYASGGVFKTENNGLTFEPIFDNQGALTIGDIALAPSNNDVLYVGTGEKNSSRSSYAGAGVFKSTDAGQSWKFIGLEGIQHTSRIVVNPQDPNMVWVASLGSLYSNNVDRGVYKSTDGGDTWSKTLFVNDSTGIIDLIINPKNPKQLWAASWERTRKAWNFKGNGIGSAIYSSEDGGDTWQKSMNGFPESETNGRIGLALCAEQPNVLYAFHDNQLEVPDEDEDEKDEDKFELKDFVKMDNATFLSLPNKKLDEFLEDEGFPDKYDAKKVKEEIKAGKYSPKALVEYFGDANKALFETKILGAEVYRSDDFGKSWTRVNENEMDGVYFTYGYYFGEIRVVPNNPDEFYLLGYPLLKSLDGGKSYARIDSIGDVHVDHQAMWINPKDSRHVLLGNDGGLYVSYNGGANWFHINNTSVGQFYTVNVDMEKPYNVYGGLQDNGTLVGSSKSVPNRTKFWEELSGGDGMFVNADPRNADIVYTGYQFGNYFRADRASGKRSYITPAHDIGEASLRFNWRTPLIMSEHNADILYIGAQKVYRSLDQGESWDAISDDLTKDKFQGNVPFSTITEIAESPLKFGLLYAGTDDGNLQLSKDGGGSWVSISNGLPQNKWVSSISPSNFEEGTVYVSLTGYRDDDFHCYVYKSDDYGNTWKNLKSNLPEEAVNVILEDPVAENLLYLGTDHATYISMNGGDQWVYVSNIPNVASYDMVVHPRENELVVATHGRSMYVMDVKPFHALDTLSNKAIVAFEPGSVRHSDRWGEKRFSYSEAYEPEMEIMYYMKDDTQNARMSIMNSDKKVIRSIDLDGAKGFHRVNWDLKEKITSGKRKKDQKTTMEYVGKGKYTVKITAGNAFETTEVEVK